MWFEVKHPKIDQNIGARAENKKNKMGNIHGKGFLVWQIN